MSKINLSIYSFAKFIVAISVLFLVFSGKSWATNYFLPDYGIWQSNLPSCLPSTCVPFYGSYCYNGPNQSDPGNCSNSCLIFGDPWTKYTAECVNYGGCTSGYKFDVSFMTSDKCISGETGLRPGTCSPGGYGG